jgi:hypothetical protein
MKAILKVTKSDPRVKDAWSEARSGDGYWIDLNRGWCSSTTQCHSLHEDSVRGVLKELSTIVPCTCNECRPASI